MAGETTVMVVDDEPANIKILHELLKDRYTVTFATNGEDALTLANYPNQPDLILLDILMPDINGYDVCKQLKASSRTSKIPVIFLTALEKPEDEAKGFEIGCVDYIIKPFSPPIVLARVSTHIELVASRTKVELLLSKTLTGSVKTLANIMSMFNPVVFRQGSRLKRCTSQIGRKLNLTCIWQLEIAAMLSQIGSITIPEKIMKKYRVGSPLTKKELALIQKIPQEGKTMLSHVPSFETIAEIIGRQRAPLPKTEFETWDYVTVCSQILKLVYDYDDLVLSGRSSRSAMQILYQARGMYHRTLVEMLSEVERSRPKSFIRAVELHELKRGMVLLEDIICDDNVVLVRKLTEISGSHLRLLYRNAEVRHIREPFEVLEPEKLDKKITGTELV